MNIFFFNFIKFGIRVVGCTDFSEYFFFDELKSTKDHLGIGF